MSSLTVGTLNVTDKLVIPRLTSAQIAALTPEEGLIVYDTDANFVQVYVNGNWVESNVGQGNQLYDFTSFVFKPSIAEGTRTGPTFNELQAAYSAAPWLNDYFTSGDFQGYQKWTVPATATYKMEAGGSKGARDPRYGITTHQGARMVGYFDLTQGDQLEIVVGGTGNSYNSPHGNETGGGGGTFVRNYTNDTILLVAGGGGGSCGSVYGNSCTRNTTTAQGQTSNGVPATTCQGNYTTTTPTVGYGGYSAGPYAGGGGGGWFGEAANDASPWHGGNPPNPKRGQAFIGGLEGSYGSPQYTSSGNGNRGGFGGAGGGNLASGGGGGGYTGGCSSGGWSSYSQHAGGGGSFNSGANQSNTRGGNNSSKGGYSGAGYFEITKQ